jgi:D-threonate/D-erythronate kinase
VAFTLGLIADDLTGASDSAVQFARRGWNALLVLDPVRLKPDTTPDKYVVSGFTRTVTDHRVLAITTDSRALNHTIAERLTADALSTLMDPGIDRLYLKIDSTMRGSVPGQIAGALNVWRRKYPAASAVVCPAYPRMGRTVVANQVQVHGQPVEQSSIGRDPVTPVTASDLAVLIPGSSHVAPERIFQKPAPIVTVDAISDDDLAKVASAIAAAGPCVIPVGSGGLAEAMAAGWTANDLGGVRLEPNRQLLNFCNPRILILVTSLNPVSRSQVNRLTEAFPDVVVLLPPAERVGNKSVAERLAEDFAERFERETWDVLGFVGGDGARAALGRLDASALQIVDAILEGIPIGIVVGGHADGTPIFTKAGGFGAEDALVRVVEALKK